MNTAIRLNTKLIGSLSSILFMSPADIMKAAGIPHSTWYCIMQVPAAITIQQLLAICNSLHIPARKFFTKGRKGSIGRRDDYIYENYQPCYYDADRLQEIVSNRSDATWQRASEITKVTPQNLRNSLLAVTRTPVTRFLVVCESFGIDPFTILIDPNPETRPKSKRTEAANLTGEAQLRQEIQTLREDIANLTDIVSDLRKKMQGLLDGSHRGDTFTTVSSEATPKYGEE